MTYSLWDLGGKRVLIRTKQFLSVLAPPNKSPSETAVSLAVKIDHQKHLLPEQISIRERSRFWIQSWIAGDRGTLFARYNVQRNELTFHPKIVSLSSLLSDPLAVSDQCRSPSQGPALLYLEYVFAFSLSHASDPNL